LPVAFLCSMINKTLKYHILIILLLKSILLNAQDINLGLRINEVSRQERETFSAIVNNTGASNLKLRNYSIELIGEKINQKNTFQRINIGIYAGQINQNKTRYFSINGKTITLNNTQTALGYGLVYGVGKIHSFNKLIFRFGVEMSGRYYTPWVIATTIEYFDTNNVNYQTLKFNDTYNPYYIFGATLLSGIHYNFYKAFSAGIEFGNSMYYIINKGTEIRTDELYNASGNLSATETESTQKNYSQWSISSLRSSFSIYYSF